MKHLRMVSVANLTAASRQIGRLMNVRAKFERLHSRHTRSARER